jgi:hypothetical protein
MKDRNAQTKMNLEKMLGKRNFRNEMKMHQIEIENKK